MKAAGPAQEINLFIGQPALGSNHDCHALGTALKIPVKGLLCKRLLVKQQSEIERAADQRNLLEFDGRFYGRHQCAAALLNRLTRDRTPALQLGVQPLPADRLGNAEAAAERHNSRNAGLGGLADDLLELPALGQRLKECDRYSLLRSARVTGYSAAGRGSGHLDCTAVVCQFQHAAAVYAAAAVGSVKEISRSVAAYTTKVVKVLTPKGVSAEGGILGRQHEVAHRRWTTG